ncbi:unnamed protein product [Macrosiphum euphorbiae]|uniref:Endonuclease/exonuclease/phosphatase domain-containing protein n=1 Tax=Macrosiphum euphorbiae TaxID=13131 RepID=A0AAV0X8M5_9HEMI|nr:unnamed protein product [Macrosiphum euphorbiae]
MAKKKNSNTLDLFVTKLPHHLLSRMENFSDLCSDHSPLSLTINKTIATRTSNCFLLNGYINWKTFNQTLTRKTIPNTQLQSLEDINEAIN